MHCRVKELPILRKLWCFAICICAPLVGTQAHAQYPAFDPLTAPSAYVPTYAPPAPVAAPTYYVPPVSAPAPIAAPQYATTVYAPALPAAPVPTPSPAYAPIEQPSATSLLAEPQVYASTEWASANPALYAMIVNVYMYITNPQLGGYYSPKTLEFILPHLQACKANPACWASLGPVIAGYADTIIAYAASLAPAAAPAAAPVAAAPAAAAGVGLAGAAGIGGVIGTLVDVAIWKGFVEPVYLDEVTRIKIADACNNLCYPSDAPNGDQPTIYNPLNCASLAAQCEEAKSRASYAQAMSNWTVGWVIGPIFDSCLEYQSSCAIDSPTVDQCKALLGDCPMTPPSEENDFAGPIGSDLDDPAGGDF